MKFRSQQVPKKHDQEETLKIAQRQKETLRIGGNLIYIAAKG